MEHAPALPQQLLHVLRDVPPRHVYPPDAVGYREALEYGHRVRHAVAGVQHYACRFARGVEGQHRLHRGVQRGHVECLEQDLCGGITVFARVQRGLSEKHGMLSRHAAVSLSPWCIALGAGATHILAHSLQLLRVDVLPYPLHIVPVCDYAVLQRVVNLEQAPVLLCLRPNEDVALQRAGHGPHMFWPPYKRWEEAFWYVLSCETSSDGAAAVVQHNGRIVKPGAHCGVGVGEGLGALRAVEEKKIEIGEGTLRLECGIVDSYAMFGARARGRESTTRCRGLRRQTPCHVHVVYWLQKAALPSNPTTPFKMLRGDHVKAPPKLGLLNNTD